MSRVRVAMVQTNSVVGDLDGNVERIRAVLDQVEACDLAVFPEMTVAGYPLEDLVLKPGFVSDCRAAVDRVAASSGSCALVVGFPDGAPGGPTEPGVQNAAAVCHDGRVVGVYHKRALPNYDVFDEARHFVPGVEPLRLYEIGGVRVGFVVCEDLWVADSPVGSLVEGGAELLVAINGSPYHRGMLAEREAVVAATAASSGLPVVYVNLVGGQDELVFDGGSMVADPAGLIVARAPRFEEAVVVVDIDVACVPASETDLPTVIVSGPVDRSDHVVAAPVDPLDPSAELYGVLVTATRDYVTKSGFTDVCIGLSGGIDSALVAAVAADALGPDHVHAVLMPSRYSSGHSVADATDLATTLGIDHRTVHIEAAHATLLALLEESLGEVPVGSTDENLQARIRGVLLMAHANASGWLVLTTGNKSESAVGYSTLYGDTAGAFAVIKDIYKLTVYELARWRNNQPGGPVISENIVSKPPSAELRPDQRDDQSLPPYEVLDPLLEAYIEGDRTRADLVADGFGGEMVDRVTRLVDLAEFKRRQTPPGTRVSRKGFGRDRRLPIVNRYSG
ncbi:MAG: NAD+ synthase [Acidimicrobiales bacterium]|jgi:NAD+ synthase (glutamine-hydrolysing)|nr:NAD+ synthase [Acidimicrobiales bacterium]